MKKGIGARIITMAVIISAIAAVIGCIGLYTTKLVSSKLESMYQDNLLGVRYADQIQYQMQSCAVALLHGQKETTSTGIKNYSKQFTEAYMGAKKAFSDYETTMFTAEEKEMMSSIKKYGDEYAEDTQKFFDLLIAQKNSEADKFAIEVLTPIRNDKLNPVVEKLARWNINQAEETHRMSRNVASLSVMIIITAILIGLAVSFTLALMITRSITGPVMKVVNSLSESSSQIGISSTQLSTASQEIANGAQEQASSIEETTSSMEELSSMVKQNLGNTRQASLLSEKATEASQGGFDKMTSMLSAMNNISKSAEDIKNVIDVIDDIAFQTNMLALNAAVEAARAGEAGMGFAVVADEVKNLANRSSESAKETASMIKETLKNVEDGMTISKDLSEIFKDILANSRKVQEMNKEVESASGQQDEGIGQVNKAMIQFDTVVQTNASSAEETAGAAEELQGQVSSLNEIVDSLYFTVSGKTYIKKNESDTFHASVKKQAGTFPSQERQKSSENGRTLSREKQAPVTKISAVKTDSSVTGVKKGSGCIDAGHTISFEDDEDFKPV
ncbi:MAG: methyl-accepting chemotaxis protein [Treponema sp.]|nr:methyl-accepting chemotaxis protein [Treponema sp.]